MLIEQVGGGRGRLSFALAEKYSDLTFMVQDQPEMGKHIEYPPHLKDRVSFKVHDFFTPQPIVAEVYLLGAVLHDWPDNRAIEIIQNLVPAMKDGARIILAENAKMQSGSQPYFFEAIIRYISHFPTSTYLVIAILTDLKCIQSPGHANAHHAKLPGTDFSGLEGFDAKSGPSVGVL
jgi:O-methyltransferase